MKLLFLIFMSLWVFLPTVGQQQISGEVKNIDGHPLPYANIMLLSVIDSSLIKGAVSEVDGEFLLEGVNQGIFLLSVSMVGYGQYLKKFEKQEGRDLLLQSITLHESDEFLEEVTVAAQKPLYEKQIDRLVVNVQESITAAGNSVLKVLSSSPGVFVNQQQFSISLNGREGVMVMINNNLSRMPMESVLQMLEGMSAANVEKIELISQPPAHLDSEGTRGIIRIVMKENAEIGTNGSFGITAGINKREVMGSNFNVNHRKGNFSFFSDYSVLYSHTVKLFVNENQLHQQGFINHLYSEFDRAQKSIVQNFRSGMGFNIGSKTAVGGVLALNRNRFLGNGLAESLNKLTQDSTVFTNILFDEKRLLQNISTNVHLVQQINTKHKIKLDYDWLNYTFNNPTTYDQDFHYLEEGGQRSKSLEINNHTPMKFHITTIDYFFTVSPNFKLQAGLKSNRASFKNKVEAFNIESGTKTIEGDFTSNSDMRESITAGYLSTEWTINEVTQLNTGIRYEHTLTRINSSRENGRIFRDFGNPFPSLSIKRSLKNGMDLFFGYSKRITRPTLNDLTPMVLIINPNTVFVGNPSLRPAILDAIELDIKIRKAIVSLDHGITKNEIVKFQPEFNLENNVQLFRTQNFINTKISGVNLSIPWIISDWWDFHGNFQFQYRRFETSHLEVNNKYRLYDMNLNMVNNFILPRRFSAEISGFYQSRKTLGMWIYRPMGSLNIGLQKKLKDDRGIFKFSAMDILSTNNMFSTSNIQDPQVDLRVDYYLRLQTFTLSFTKNFGNRKLKAVNIKSASEEDRKRVEMN